MKSIEILTSLATLVALFFTIRQTVFARRALEASKISIDEDKRARQLSMTGKMSWIIEAKIRLEKWLKELETTKREIRKASVNNDESRLKYLANAAPHGPADIPYGISLFIYENMPEPFLTIMMSGAQYYYDAAVTGSYLWTTSRGPDWEYAGSIIGRFEESITKLIELKKLITDAVPEVLLNTPASISDSSFVS